MHNNKGGNRIKGKKITNQEPLEGAFDFFEALSAVAKGESARDDVFTDNTMDGIVIDTCKPLDTMVWETGINRANVEGKWVIVSQYENKSKAEKGHKGWVELMKQDPTCELTDINLWNL